MIVVLSYMVKKDMYNDNGKKQALEKDKLSHFLAQTSNPSFSYYEED